MPHNVYIYFLATGGLAAFASVAGYIFFMFRYLMRLLREQGHNPIIWGMLLMVIAFLAHGMVDASLISRHIGRIYYLLLGLGVLFANALKEDNK